jgi:hypothetical protein
MESQGGHLATAGWAKTAVAAARVRPRPSNGVRRTSNRQVTIPSLPIGRQESPVCLRGGSVLGALPPNQLDGVIHQIAQHSEPVLNAAGAAGEVHDKGLPAHARETAG